MTDAARSEFLRRDARELLDGGFACHVSGSPGLAHTVLIVEMLTIRPPSRIRRAACCIDGKVPFVLTAMTRPQSPSEVSMSGLVDGIPALLTKTFSSPSRHDETGRARTSPRALG